MASQKSKLRIQLSSTAKISLRPQCVPPQTGPKATSGQAIDSRKMPPLERGISVGMVLRSCLASVDAMLPEVDDHRADTETEIPDFNMKFKGCLAAVGATIEAGPGTDFNVGKDMTQVENEDSSEVQLVAIKEESNAINAAVVPRKRGRPKKVVPLPIRSIVYDCNTSERGPESSSPLREAVEESGNGKASLRERALAKTDAVESSPATPDSTAPANPTVGPVQETVKRGRGKPKKLLAPREVEETPAVKSETPSKHSADEAPNKRLGAESAEVPELRRGRGRKRASEVEPSPETPTKSERPAKEPRRGRKRTKPEIAPSAEDVHKEQLLSSGEAQKLQLEHPKKIASNTEPSEKRPVVEVEKRKRGRPRLRRPSKEEEVVGQTAAGKPELAAAEVNKIVATAARTSLRAADDSDSTDTVIEEAGKVKRRGRPPMSEEARAAKLLQKSAKGKSKKTVLKVAIPIRTRSSRGQPVDKSEESLSAEEAGSQAKSQPQTISLPPPPPPALTASRSRSPSPKSPRGSARTTRVHLKKKPQRTSHASDTDTAEETLDQEEFLRQQEKLGTKAGAPTSSGPQVLRTISVSMSTAGMKALPSSSTALDEPASKKQKAAGGVDGSAAKAALFDAPALEGKRERKRKALGEFANPNAVLEVAPTTIASGRMTATSMVTAAAAAAAAATTTAAATLASISASTATTTTTTTTTTMNKPLPAQQPMVRMSPVGASAVGSSAATASMKPMVTIVNPMTMVSKPNISLVSTSQPSCSYVKSGLEPIVITVPPNGTRPINTSFPGVTKTIVVPRVNARPVVHTIQPHAHHKSPHQQHLHQSQIRSIRLSPSLTSAAARRTSAPTTFNSAGQRALSSPIRITSVQTPTSTADGGVVIRTLTPGSFNSPRLVSGGTVRPSIIRGPRIVTTLATCGGLRPPRLLSSMSSGGRIVSVRPSMTGATLQTIRTAVPGQPNKVFIRTVAPIIPQRHITVQATPTLPPPPPTAKASTETTVSRPVSAAMVIRTPPKASPTTIVKSFDSAAQSGMTKKIVQQVVKPVERKAPPTQPKKAPVQPRKVVNVARVAPETMVQTTTSSSAINKLLEEPQLPKVGKKPLSKKQRSMRKTDLIKTSTRSRRRGTDLQINYNEDRLSKITDEDTDSQEDTPTSAEELGPPEEIQPADDNDEQEPQDDIPVAVVEVFLSQDEVKLREVHSPTKQDLVDLSRQPVEQPMEVALGGQGAPEGFFTSEEGLVESVDGALEGAAIETVKAGLVSNNDNAFAKSLMLGDDALLRKKVSKRKSNPLAKD